MIISIVIRTIVIISNILILITPNLLDWSKPTVYYLFGFYYIIKFIFLL